MEWLYKNSCILSDTINLFIAHTFTPPTPLKSIELYSHTYTWSPPDMYVWRGGGMKALTHMSLFKVNSHWDYWYYWSGDKPRKELSKKMSTKDLVKINVNVLQMTKTDKLWKTSAELFIFQTILPKFSVFRHPVSMHLFIHATHFLLLSFFGSCCWLPACPRRNLLTENATTVKITPTCLALETHFHTLL